MAILQQVLQEFESVGGPISVRELSHRLGVETSALEGMLEFLVRKGRLVDNSQPVSEMIDGCDLGFACAGACPGARSCPFAAAQPKTYSLKKRVQNGR